MSILQEVNYHEVATLRILLSGATGMLGSQTKAQLKKSFPQAELYLFARSHNFTQEDDQNWVELEDLVDNQFNLIVHAGSPASPLNHTSASNVFKANVELTESLVSSVLPGGCFIFFSTGEIYGQTSSEAIGEDFQPAPILFEPRSYYPLSKLAGESIALARADIRSVVLRIFHTFGPGVREGDGRSFADFLWGAYRNRELKLFSSGSQVRTFLDSRDLASAVVTVAKDSNASGIYNAGSEVAVTVLEFAELVAELSGSEITFEDKSNFQSELSDLERLVPCVKRLRSLGWSPSLPLEKTILDTLASFSDC